MKKTAGRYSLPGEVRKKQQGKKGGETMIIDWYALLLSLWVFLYFWIGYEFGYRAGKRKAKGEK